MRNNHEKKEPKNMLRLVSLLLSLLLWVNFSGRVDVSQASKKETYWPVPLIHDNKPDGIEILDDQGTNLHVTLGGSEKELDAIGVSDIIVTLDLTRTPKGKHTFPLNADNVTLPPRFKDVKVMSIFPDRISLRLEHFSSKKVRLFLNVVGQPHPDYEVIDEKAIPEEVTMTGPTQRLKGITIFPSEEVDITGATADVTGQFVISSEMPPDAYLQEQYSDLRYRIRIQERQDIKHANETYKLVRKIQEGEEAQWKNWQVNEQPYSLGISGPISVVRWFEPSWVAPKITMSTANAIYSKPNPSPQGAGTDPMVEDNHAKFIIVNEWILPEDVRTNTPDWLEKVSQLQLTWEPQEVEVVKP